MRQLHQLSDDEMADYLNGLAGVTRSIVPDEAGLIIVLTDPATKRVHYVSDRLRADAAQVLRELADRLEGGN